MCTLGAKAPEKHGQLTVSVGETSGHSGGWGSALGAGHLQGLWGRLAEFCFGYGYGYKDAQFILTQPRVFVVWFSVSELYSTTKRWTESMPSG